MPGLSVKVVQLFHPHPKFRGTCTTVNTEEREKPSVVMDEFMEP
jgi:hypothetical protein